MDCSLEPSSSIVLNRPQSSPIVPNRPQSSPIVLGHSQFSPVLSSRDSHMANTTSIHPACDCAEHQTNYQNWPRENAEIRIASCMRVCPFCAKRHSNASRLRKHLRQRKYRDRNISIASERPGAVGVGHFPVHNQQKSQNQDCIGNHLKSYSPILSTNSVQSTPQDDLNSSLREIQANFGPEFGVLSICHLSYWNRMSEQNQDLWLESTSSVPRLLNSSHCWRVRAPLARELFMDTIEEISTVTSTTQKSSESRFRANFQGEVDEKLDPYIVLSQLIDPDLNKPAFLTGLRLPSIDHFGFCSPCEMSTTIEPFDETNDQVNLTPKYSFVDLHIDYGADGLSTVIGDCRKIWLLYPPTDDNLNAMKSIDGQRGKLVRLMRRLEGGVLVETTSSHAIFLPAGCAHATFTLQGGYLVAKDFTTAKSLSAIASFITCGLDENLPTEAREICFDWFERCLDVTLSQQRVVAAISAWLKAEKKTCKLGIDSSKVAS
ncbi:hypothetical protein N7494_006988 [Penicillium frequentans]|uniref:JmjC domain-containing protein n=1 Tax=Penicillium frequentans TaxID=3151616 RepID=A0AAD6GDS4_9EURO|nr:hypothetical protein N7494_006988 [Penicillium glabrum]